MTDQSEALMVQTAERLESRYYGKYRGLVKEVGEGDDLGYIRAQVPEVYGEDVLSPWAAPSVPFAGASHGWVTLPEDNDGVWIEFEAGNMSKPIWTGFFWAKGEMPKAGAPKTRVFATTNGHQIVLDDDKNELRLEHAGGASIVLTSTDITLKVKGKNIVISSASVSVNNGSLQVT